jgi:putative aldouronate transport system substrate-binding protein
MTESGVCLKQGLQGELKKKITGRIRMNKKLFSILMVTTLAVTMIGCSSKSSNSSDKPELRMLVPYEHIDHNKDIVALYLKDKTGYPVKYEQLPAEEPDQKLNLLMANKEKYDIMKLSESQFFKLATTGALEPLDDLIAKFGPTMKEVISSQSWAGTKVNGKTYAIPETGEGIFVGTELAVRQDWMDELSLKMPTNRDELYTVLKTIKEKKNVIPLVGYEGTSAYIASTFGITGNWKEVSGKLVHPVEDPAIRDYLAFMNKLYKEGLIDSEWPINKANDKVLEKFTSGKAAMFQMAWWDAPGVTAALTKNFPQGKIGLVPYLKGNDGKAIVGVTGGIGNYIVISKYAKNKEAAMKYMDLKLTKDIFKGMVIGEEGVHFQMKDGKYYPINPKFSDERNSSSWFLTGVDEKNYPLYWQARVRKNPLIQQYFEAIQENSKGLTVLNPLSFTAPVPEISKNLQKLSKFQDDSFLKFIAGTDPVESYDKFLAQWKSDGGDEMTKGANDAFKAKK